MSIKINKNGKGYPLGFMPQHYPADRVYLDGDISKTVQDALNYSTDEHVVGEWIDGSILYEKTVDCGALPNATSKNIAHNISNLKRIVFMCGYAYRSNGGNFMPLPFAHEGVATGNVSLACNSTNIIITDGSDRSAFAESYVTIRYTKA